MRVAVLGSSGAMGAFFTSYFVEHGHTVTGFDRRGIGRHPRGFRRARSNSEAVRGADLILVAVPIRETANVVREVSPFLKEGSTVVEIASLKAKLLAELRRILVKRNISLLSLHPLFGPHARSKQFKICVIGGRRDVLAARRLFPRARLIQLGARAHDRLMAYNLSLVHLSNLAFISVVAKGIGTKKFDRASTPSASEQLNLSKAVLAQDPSLFSYIQVENPFVSEVISSLISELEGIRRSVGRKDAAGLENKFVNLAKKFGKTDLDEALVRVYAASDS